MSQTVQVAPSREQTKGAVETIVEDHGASVSITLMPLVDRH